EDPEPSEPQERAPEEHEPRRDGSSEGRRALSSPGRREPAHRHVPDSREQTRQQQLGEMQAHGGREGDGRKEDGRRTEATVLRGLAGTADQQHPEAERGQRGRRGRAGLQLSAARHPRTQQSKDSDQMEEAEQPQGRRCQSQGGQRTSGRLTSGDLESRGTGEQAPPVRRESEGPRSRVREIRDRRGRGIQSRTLDMGRSAGRSGVGLSVARNAIATTNHAVLDQLNLLSEEELDTACKEAGWRGEWREAVETETGGAGQDPSTTQPQVPPHGAPRILGQGDRQQVGPGQHGGPPPSINWREADGIKTGGAGQDRATASRSARDGTAALPPHPHPLPCPMRPGERA
ncbi:hypothetical protein B484DRAFT_410287, partial [Ochromonadaceae sp. CCMP2298]